METPKYEQPPDVTMTMDDTPTISVSTPAGNEIVSEVQMIDNIDTIRTVMQQVHDSGMNFTYQWRIEQLRILRTMLIENWDLYCDALQIDLGKCQMEAIATELVMIRTELDYTISNLKSWMKTKPIPSPALCAPAYSYVQHRPLLGPAVLILGPCNYPVSLVLHPAIGALAAGNPVIIKPSELTPNVASLLQRLVHAYFPNNVMVCVTGGIPVTTKLISYPWGRIFFTGSTKVGIIISQAGATTMTPVTLECGGKSPCYIDAETTWKYTTDTKLLQQIAQRIIWSKTLNSGQTCAATDTLVCHEDMVPYLVPQLIQSIQTMFGMNPMTDSEFGRIVSVEHTERLISMIKEVEDYITLSGNNNNTSSTNHTKKCEIVYGSSKQCDALQKYITPTIIVNPPNHCRIVQEEIFGPILSIITVSDRNDAIHYMRTQMIGTPLCMYVFTDSDRVFQQLVQQVPAGAVVRNDCLIHLCSPYIPFGGLGTSGCGGTYHGKYTFDLFTHTLPIMYRPYIWPRWVYDWNVLRCHPFTPFKKYITLQIAMKLPSIPALYVRFNIIFISILLAIFLGVWFGIDH